MTSSVYLFVSCKTDAPSTVRMEMIPHVYRVAFAAVLSAKFGTMHAAYLKLTVTANQQKLD